MSDNHINHRQTCACLTLSDNGEKQTFPLPARVNKIGSGCRNHVVLPFKDVAENHACIIFEMGQYRLVSIDKKELRINGALVKASSTLNNGDRIEIGTLPVFFIHEYCAPENAGNPASPNLQKTFSASEGKEALRLFSGIVETITQLLEVNDYRQTAARLVGIVARLMQCDGVRLLMNTQAGLLQPVAVFPQSASDGRFSQTAIRWAESEGCTVLVADIQNEARLPFEESLVIKDITSVLCAPLGKEKERRVGYLYLDRLKGHAPFTQADREFFEELRNLFANLLDNAIQKEEQAEAIRRLSATALSSGKEPMIFQCTAMEELIRKSVKIAHSDIPVLIEGETGTGKEVLARFLHQASPRNTGQFIAINCGAIPENLMESEFFGHEKGAFTGADASKKGHMAAAYGGTLFLDEISELPLSLQVKFLRALQQKEVLPLGASKAVPVDCRIIAASNKSLQDAIAAGRFRQDLFFRINVVSLILPPLRERERDVVLLANHFIKCFAGQYGIRPKPLSSAAEKALIAFRWPGNVRELENKIQKAMVLSSGPAIRPEDLDLQPETNKECLIETMEAAREKAEQEAARKALLTSKGNVSLAAKLLAMDRTVLIHLLEKLGMDPISFKPTLRATG